MLLAFLLNQIYFLEKQYLSLILPFILKILPNFFP